MTNYTNRVTLVLLAVTSLVLAFLLTAKFGASARGYIGEDGNAVITGRPVNLWTVCVWPVAALSIGGISGLLFSTSIRLPLRILGAAIAGMLVTYAFAGIAGRLWPDGLYGLLAFHGRVSLLGFLICPACIVLGASGAVFFMRVRKKSPV
jgi:hypothetical protein